MPKSVLTDQRLKRIAEAKSAQILLWKEGISIERDTGAQIPQLLCRVASDRWKLASRFNQQAFKLITTSPPHFRSAISRFYYCMYHAMRACVYVETAGDDHEPHSELPLHIPKSFDPTTNWQNKLKDARLLRNRADYEAYPKAEAAWRKHAVQIETDAKLLLKTARVFLKSKGCNL